MGALAGDVVTIDFGIPAGSGPGFEHPAIVVTADLERVTANGDHGNVGPVALAQLRSVIADLLDLNS